MEKEKDLAPEIHIDRIQENKDILTYQETGDEELLSKVFQQRIPTLMHWANKHYYPGLEYSVKDLYSELVHVFMIAAKKYQKGRGSFNTCLYTFLDNRLKNIKNAKYAKKRTGVLYDGPLSGLTLSLNHPYYSDGADQGMTTLEDKIENEHGDTKESMDEISLEESIELLSKNDKIIREFLLKLSQGSTLNAIVKEYKTKTEYIFVDDIELNNADFKNIILQKHKDEPIKFKILDIRVERVKNKNKVIYSLEFKKTKESDSIMKLVRKIRKNKTYYMKLIGMS